MAVAVAAKDEKIDGKTEDTEAKEKKEEAKKFPFCLLQSLLYFGISNMTINSDKIPKLYAPIAATFPLILRFHRNCTPTS